MRTEVKILDIEYLKERTAPVQVCLCNGVEVRLSVRDLSLFFNTESSPTEMPEISCGNKPRLMFSLFPSFKLRVTFNLGGTSNVSRRALPPKSISNASKLAEAWRRALICFCFSSSISARSFSASSSETKKPVVLARTYFRVGRFCSFVSGWVAVGVVGRFVTLTFGGLETDAGAVDGFSGT